ncbi:MAG: alpha/beta hydrolase [Planctomycetota bacterium]|nr:alpha/beta hydrolase [Planctomycetota bacterium]
MIFTLGLCLVSALTPSLVSAQSKGKTEAASGKAGSRKEKTDSDEGGKSRLHSEKIPAGKSVTRKYDFKDAGKEMEYQLYLPENYYEEIEKDARKKFPLIVALHGYGSNPKQIVGYPGFMRNANRQGYLIVAPMGYNKFGWYGSHGSRGGYGNLPRNIGELSEKDVMNVLEITRKDFQIDPDRIFLYGHSMGGGGSIHLAMKYPDIWAAVAPMAPAVPWGMKNLKQASKIPFFVVHGDKDKVLPVKNTRAMIEKMKALEIKHQYIEVEGGDHVLVAFRYWNRIFDFFEQHPRNSRKGDGK